MNNNNKLSETFPKLLNNAPCEEDLFEGKSHQNIAHAICHTILNNTKANIIGIDGDWGSGKSNLVGLIKKNLDEKNYIFFIYDAW